MKPSVEDIGIVLNHMACVWSSHLKATKITKPLATAKPSVENWDGLLDNMAVALRHPLIKAESTNLQVNY